MKSILVYHIGSLGDTFAIVPALKALRDNFPEAQITMLCNQPLPGAGATPDSVLEGSGLVDAFIFYPLNKAWGSILSLILQLRREKFDLLCYLIRNPDGRFARDRFFFKLCGIPRIVGATQVDEQYLKQPDILLRRLRSSGLIVGALYDTSLPDVEIDCGFVPKAQGRTVVGFGVGGKNPACLWPADRYEELGSLLIKQLNIFPVVFGAKAESDLANRLIAFWGLGENVCGRFDIRETIHVMKILDIFIGNDTGTIHMAASAGIPCLGIYSARNKPNLWEPYGDQHLILRKNKQFECSECGFEVCPKGNACINVITVNEVIDSFYKLLQNTKNAKKCL